VSYVSGRRAVHAPRMVRRDYGELGGETGG
jgi:hypothetical protein